MVVLVVVVGIVAALSLDRGGDDTADPRPSDPTSADSEDATDESSEPTDEPETEEPRDELVLADLYGAESYGPICEGTAVITDAQPYPEDPQQLSDLVLEVAWGVPQTDPPVDATWVHGAPPTEVTPPTGLAGLNAFVCVVPVDGTVELRELCVDGTRVDGTRGSWDVYSSDYEIFTVDPTTGEVVREAERFSSLDLPNYGEGCENGPAGILGEPPTVATDVTLPDTSAVLGPYVDELVAP